MKISIVRISLSVAIGASASVSIAQENAASKFLSALIGESTSVTRREKVQEFSLNGLRLGLPVSNVMAADPPIMQFEISDFVQNLKSLQIQPSDVIGKVPDLQALGFTNVFVSEDTATFGKDKVQLLAFSDPANIHVIAASLNQDQWNAWIKSLLHQSGRFIVSKEAVRERERELMNGMVDAKDNVLTAKRDPNGYTLYLIDGYTAMRLSLESPPGTPTQPRFNAGISKKSASAAPKLAVISGGATNTDPQNASSSSFEMDSWIVPPKQSDYCLANVCLGMTVDQLPDVPQGADTGRWYFPGAERWESPRSRFDAFNDFKNAVVFCGRSGDLRWARKAVLKHSGTANLEIEVEAQPRERVSSRSTFAVTRVSFRLKMDPSSAATWEGATKAKWPELKPRVKLLEYEERIFLGFMVDWPSPPGFRLKTSRIIYTVSPWDKWDAVKSERLWQMSPVTHELRWMTPWEDSGSVQKPAGSIQDAFSQQTGCLDRQVMKNGASGKDVLGR